MPIDEPVVITTSPKSKIPKLLILGLVAVLLTAIVIFTIYQKLSIKHPPVVLPPPATDTTKISLPCPSTPQFCQSAKEVIEDGQFKGISISVEKNSPIMAVFDGKTLTRSYTIAKKGTFTHITLTSTKGDLTAVYYLSKASPKEGPVKKGEIIGTATDPGILMFLLLDKNHQPIPKSRIVFENGK